ncbi:MAG: peptidoglycan glycosyltransferase [Opitutaceae bacterium]|nr:peptidoglycan glycosyltransferase [Opitutaceae bacterium]MBP9913266.1 peptidoglycan glycosyltransferase [Opitutaceae bacterium]
MAGNLADQSGNLVESHKGYDPRVILFYFIMALLLAVLAAGLAYQQLFKADLHHERERMQSQRRILVPGPRGNIYDRDGRLLVGNRPRFAVVLYLDELRSQFRREFLLIRKNYRAAGDRDLPSSSQLEALARTSVVQRYLDQVNDILRRNERVDGKDLRRHFARQLLLPYTLIDDLDAADYARLIESLPVRSPLQVYTSSTRRYPFGSAASHTLGYVGVDSDIEAEDFPGDDLRTFKMKGSVGRDGLEKNFDALLQGEAGGTIFRVDPSGYKINPPIERRLPVQGHNLTTTLDIELQQAAEEKLAQNDTFGAAVALDVRTGEVLVLASKPDYNLSDFSPRLTFAASADIEKRQAWANRAISSAYPPGSTFKILTSIAAMRSGTVKPDEPIIDCDAVLHRFGRNFVCYNGKLHHGEILLPDAIAQSCDIFFYEAGWRTTPDLLAAEARRFHLDQPTGIELPHETSRMVVPDPQQKLQVKNERWFPGDTANMAIGQGDVLMTPLGMACFAASVARGEVLTQPTLIHRPDAPAQHSESIGLTPVQRAALLAGMEGTTLPPRGTARLLTTLDSLRVPGVRIAGKTGTAQIPGNKNVAWFICFAPLEKPEIAIAVAIEGDTAGEEYGGGIYAVPVASAILRKYFEKKNRPPGLTLPVKTS